MRHGISGSSNKTHNIHLNSSCMFLSLSSLPSAGRVTRDEGGNTVSSETPPFPSPAYKAPMTARSIDDLSGYDALGRASSVALYPLPASTTSVAAPAYCQDIERLPIDPFIYYYIVFT